jgi:hypothetical protein
MASGKFWAGVLPANTDQDTGATPADKVRTVSLNLVNLGTTSTTLKIYIGLNAAPTEADRIEPDVVIPAGGLYKLSGEVVGAGERVILHVNTTTITARVSGFEETA